MTESRQRETGELRAGPGKVGEDGCRRALDVEPHAVLSCDRGQFTQRIDRAGGGRACHADDRDRPVPGASIVVYPIGQGVEADASGPIGRDEPERAPAHP
ncbi:hypothetical protein H074_25937 [Amycolatopsis decaplanina DSM 44594]|uniref:Uncharacterized protein n=1 Tax=Amycolatopsis decaplanina DSM 44594 TaxID=1284240 RepID=M2Z332_9PSEU|nr:hypothetical protein [Amycolatopsis decaplanina]EME55014.1 hypothetical protein H074_25937 [Amycolatopsis decaplanina DSM 44594]